MRRSFACVVVALTGLAAQAAGAQAGTFAGIVTRDTLEHPVPHAEVRLSPSGRATQTDERGEFRFVDVPAGRYAVSIRAIGFELFTDSITVESGKTLDGDLTLTPVATRLETLRTTAVAADKTPPMLRDFEARRAMHLSGAAFISDSALRTRDDVAMSSLISMLPGVHAVLGNKSGSGVYLASGIGTTGRAFQAPTKCFVTVYIDGQKIFQNGEIGNENGPPDFTALRVSDFAGVEYYASPSMAPSQYSATGSGCGVILLWRRQTPH